MIAARLHAFAANAEGIRVESLTLPEPAPGEALVRMRLAPVNPADLNVIAGTYGRLPHLPSVIGNEGVGEIVACGRGCPLPIGTLVRPREGVGSWCQALVAPAERLQPLPVDLADDQAAQLAVNPATAWAVLEEFVTLSPGDWVLANGGTAAVVHALIALAISRGLRIAVLVRRAEVVEAVRAAGATLVLVDDRAAAKALRAQLTAPARLALNLVGGDSASTLAKALAPGGTLVTIGAMARAPLSVANGPLIFNELRLAGFWVSRWYDRTPEATVTRMLRELGDLIRADRLHLPVARVFPLCDLPAALAAASSEARSGKVLLDCRP